MKTVKGRVLRRVPAGGKSPHALDQRPIVLDGFKLKARSAVAIGRPTFDQAVAALGFAAAALEAGPYWVGDLINYAKGRADWDEKIEQLKGSTGLAEQTLYNICYVAEHVPDDIREISPSPAHTAEVASLEEREQRRFLEKSVDEGWTRRELRQNIKAAKRPRIIEGQAVLEGMFRVIYADCPWEYRQDSATADGSLAKAVEHYPPMSLEDLCALPVAAHSMPDSILFSWATAPMLEESLAVMKAWGFTYKSFRVWNKVLGNPGNYGMQVEHEVLLVGTRGSCLPDVPTPHDHSVETIRRSNTHSEKPEAFREYITRHWTYGPYLELFARKPVEGWQVFGNDARLWALEK